MRNPLGISAGHHRRFLTPMASLPQRTVAGPLTVERAEGAGDHDQVARFGWRHHVSAPIPLNRQHTRLRLLRGGRQEKLRADGEDDCPPGPRAA